MTGVHDEKKGKYYHLKVKGVLNEKWVDWFDGFTLTSTEEDETVLAGRVADQSALHGLLAKIRDLGLTLLSVQLSEE